MKVLLITLDDVGWELLAAANTPRLDSIRANSKQFTRFIAAPNCSNFRAKLESGYYSPRPENLIGGILKSDDTYSLPAGAFTLGNCGATTSHVGKWHCCDHTRYGHRGIMGYNTYFGSQANLYPGNYFDWQTVENGYPSQTQTYATDYVRTMALVRIASGDDYIGVCFNCTHFPVHAPPGYSEASEAAMLSYADTAIGDIHDAAINAGYLVLITSDNGGTKGDGKGTLLTSNINTLLALSGPWPATRACDAPVDTTDLHATVWELVAGFLAPTDGVPLTHPRPYAFCDKFSHVGTPPGPKWEELATDGQLILIRRPSSGGWTLTDWDGDPSSEDPGPLLAALDGRLS